MLRNFYSHHKDGMNVTRREMLKGISSVVAIAAAGEPESFASSRSSSESMGASANLPWPRLQGNPVIESLRPVIENSRDVHTNYDKVRGVAGWMAY